MIEGKPTKHILMIDDEDKKRLTEIAEKARVEIFKARNVQEMAFIIRVLIETFEHTQKCIVPFKNRYTEPVFIYSKGGIE